MLRFAIIGAGILLAFTRSMWVGTIAGALWLLWWKNKWLAAPLPVLAGIVLLTNPFHVLDRDQAHRAGRHREVYDPRCGRVRARTALDPTLY